MKLPTTMKLETCRRTFGAVYFGTTLRVTNTASLTCNLLMPLAEVGLHSYRPRVTCFFNFTNGPPSSSSSSWRYWLHTLPGIPAVSPTAADVVAADNYKTAVKKFKGEFIDEI